MRINRKNKLNMALHTLDNIDYSDDESNDLGFIELQSNTEQPSA